MFAGIYRLYLRGLASLWPEETATIGPELTAKLNDDAYSALSACEIDAKATLLGDTYRGVGVSVGILGITIVFFAVAPTGLEIKNEAWLRFIGIAKVTMMFALLFLVYRGSKTRLKATWISARREAEHRRYEDLRNLKDQVQQDMHIDSATKKFHDLSKALADIAEGQISYNKAKSVKYHTIEKISEVISWLEFAIALFCAVWLLGSEFHWFPHQAWLIFGTAFIPALVGGIHGINGFLNIGGLADEHGKIARDLDGIRSELKSIKSADNMALRVLAERAYN